MSQNRYVYCGNNPVLYVDPSGQIVICIGAVAAAPEVAATAVAVGTAAVAATVELASEAKEAWDRYWAEKQSFNDKLEDIENNPENWEKTGEVSVPSTKLGNRGGESIEEEFTNKYTGEKLWRHTLKSPTDRIIDQHYRPYPKQ